MLTIHGFICLVALPGPVTGWEPTGFSESSGRWLGLALRPAPSARLRLGNSKWEISGFDYQRLGSVLRSAGCVMWHSDDKNTPCWSRCQCQHPRTLLPGSVENFIFLFSSQPEDEEWFLRASELCERKRIRGQRCLQNYTAWWNVQITSSPTSAQFLQNWNWINLHVSVWFEPKNLFFLTSGLTTRIEENLFFCWDKHTHRRS